MREASEAPDQVPVMPRKTQIILQTGCLGRHEAHAEQATPVVEVGRLVDLLEARKEQA